MLYSTIFIPLTRLNHYLSLRPLSSFIKINKFIPRRALLYVPASNAKMLEKASKIMVDCLVLELEDGVAMTAKENARENAKNYLNNYYKKSHQCYELGVRVNSVSSGLIEDDLKKLSGASNLPGAFMVPKIDTIDDIYTVWKLFCETYGESRIRNTETRLVIWIESSIALLNVDKILKAAKNLHNSTGFFKPDALVFGSDDYCADIGAIPSQSASEVIYARQRIVASCKAHGVQAIDSVYIDFQDEEGLRKQCLQGHSWGFTGKQVIHPKQIDIVQQCFLPNRERIDWASELIEEYSRHEKSGKGAFNFRGKMIDKPLLLQAKNVIDLVDKIR